MGYHVIRQPWMTLESLQRLKVPFVIVCNGKILKSYNCNNYHSQLQMILNLDTRHASVATFDEHY